MPALRLTGAFTGASASKTCQCTPSRPTHVSISRPQQPARVNQQQLVAQPQLQQQQRPSWVVRAGASETTSSGSSGAPEGQVSSAIMESMQAKIKDELQADKVVVSDVYGDGRHVSIDVVSSAFEGKNSVQRQRMVYKAIWLELQETVHAVDAMSTKTPQEAAA